MKELLFLAAQSYYKPLVEINKQSSKKKILEAGLKSLNNLRSQMLEILFALKIQDIELDIVVLTALGFSQIAIDRCNSSEQSKIATISSRGFVSLDDEKENWDVLQTTPNGDRFEDAGSWNTAAPDVDESILMQEKHG